MARTNYSYKKFVRLFITTRKTIGCCVHLMTNAVDKVRLRQRTWSLQAVETSSQVSEGVVKDLFQQSTAPIDPYDT